MLMTGQLFFICPLLPQCREKTVELMFEKFKSPALFLAKNAVLSAFATAKQTALVVDAGHDGTTGQSLHS